MISKTLKIIIKFACILLAAGMLALLLPRLITGVYASTRIYSKSAVPPKKIAIVFGAGLWRDGTPTPVLRDRIGTAVALLKAGHVNKLLMSGDNTTIYYNEPGAMREYALSLGAPIDAIIVDYAGRSTYDTCYRAKYIFGIEDAILVTQNFHLPRALYICSVIGLNAVGVPADLRKYRLLSLLYWNMRELPATVNALWDVHISHPLPVLGDPEFIYPPQEAQ